MTKKKTLTNNERQKILNNIATIAKEVGKYWPKHLDCAELIRRERK